MTTDPTGARGVADAALASPAGRTAFRRALRAWYDRARRDLPWRRTRDPYHIWLSEVLLQQTRVEAGRPYYERFISMFPTLADLAAARPAAVLRAWAGLGYYNRARHLHAAAKALQAAGGTLPRRAEEWRKLPGVGPYTAAAIASIAFGEPVAAVDGNVKRVLARLLALHAPPEERSTLRRLADAAHSLVPRRAPGAHNQALMELGARVCLPRRPRCGACPVRAWCAAHEQCLADKLPAAKPRRPVREIHEAALVLRCDGRILLVQRPGSGLLAAMWDLPSAELESALPARDAAQRLIRSLGLPRADVTDCGRFTHQFTHRVLQRHVFAARVAERTMPRTDRPSAWVRRDRLAARPATRLTQRILDALDEAESPGAP